MPEEDSPRQTSQLEQARSLSEAERFTTHLFDRLQSSVGRGGEVFIRRPNRVAISLDETVTASVSFTEESVPETRVGDVKLNWKRAESTWTPIEGLKTIFHSQGRFESPDGRRFDYVFPELMRQPDLPLGVIPYLSQLRGENPLRAEHRASFIGRHSDPEYDRCQIGRSDFVRRPTAGDRLPIPRSSQRPRPCGRSDMQTCTQVVRRPSSGQGCRQVVDQLVRVSNGVSHPGGRVPMIRATDGQRTVIFSSVCDERIREMFLDSLDSSRLITARIFFADELDLSETTAGARECGMRALNEGDRVSPAEPGSPLPQP